MTLLSNREEMLNLVDKNNGLVDRRIFSDQKIYELELERIFARAWNFMAHDSQIPNSGDFFMTFIGEDRVIVVRDNDGNAQVLVNSCRHRGNAICRAEESHSTSFMCTYHGWTYDLKGALVGVPGFKEVYHEELDRENWGLIKAAQVDTYRGFIFACMDPAAPGLDDYLGDVGRLCIDLLAEKGEMQAVGGVQKSTIPANWKFIAENTWDWYHVPVTHASTMMSNKKRINRTPSGRSLNQQHMLFLGKNGHALAGPMMSQEEDPNQKGRLKSRQTWRNTEKAQAALGPAIQSQGFSQIFPSFCIGGYQVELRLPKGPRQTEIWRISFLARDHIQKTLPVLRRAKFEFGPAGLLDQDDSENYEQSSLGASGVVSKRHPLNIAMGLGQGEIIEDEGNPPRIETQISEHAQLWLYRSWSEWMAAENWPNLKQSISPAPTGSV